MQREAEDVDRLLEEVRRHARRQEPDRAVRRDEAPVPVDDQRRVGLVRGEDAGDGVGDGGHREVVQPVLGVGGGEPGGEQHGVAVAQRDVEVLAQAQQHRR